MVVVVGVSFYSMDSVRHPGKLEQELEAGTRKQELMQRLWRNTAYCLVPPGLLSLFSYMPQDHLPGDALPTVGCTLPDQSSIKKKKTLQGHTYRPVLWRLFFSFEVCFSQMTLTCIKLTETSQTDVVNVFIQVFQCSVVEEIRSSTESIVHFHPLSFFNLFEFITLRDISHL